MINQISETGFFDNTNSTTDSITIQQQQGLGGFPIKKNIGIGIVVIWNLLFIIDYVGTGASGKKAMPIGTGMTIAVALLFLVSVLTLKSKDFSKLILKEGREIGDIKKFLYFIILISGFMSLILLISKIK